MRRRPGSRLALPFAVVRGVLRGICRYDKAFIGSARIGLERTALQGRLVGRLAGSRADCRRRPVVRQRCEHQMAGGRSPEMESSARCPDATAAKWTAVWLAVRVVGAALRTGACGARHRTERLFAGVPGA